MERETIPAPEPEGPFHFDAMLTPHRSLSPRGFLVMMWFVAGISFIAGMAFLIMGAWPVFGFFGLDVALIYFAFRWNYRSGEMYQRVRLNERQLIVDHVKPNGRGKRWRFEPYWVRVRVDEKPDGTSELGLISHGTRLRIADFLSPDERLEFADALRDALETHRTRHLPA